MLREAFTCEYPKSAKKTDSLTVFFALLGSFRIKAAHKILVKLTPRMTRNVTREVPARVCYASFTEISENPENRI